MRGRHQAPRRSLRDRVASLLRPRAGRLPTEQAGPQNAQALQRQMES